MNFIEGLSELFFPCDATPHPYKKTDAAVVNAKPVKADVPVNDALTYVAGKPFMMQRTDDGFVAEAVRSERSSVVTTSDLDVAAERGLKRDKLAEIKKFWAQGLTASEVATLNKGRRGYGKRTVDKYFAALNLNQ